MGEHSGIEWTDHTFNPWWGCARVSPACEHCYAETFSRRLGKDIWGAKADRRFFGDAHWGAPLSWDRKAAASGIRTRVFSGSMCDVFEDRQDLDAHRARLWRLVKGTSSLDWLLLTKRPQNVVRMAPGGTAWGSNVWLGTTGEDQRRADERLPHLVAQLAVVRFLSIEPLLGEVDLRPFLPDIDWIILGGESGPGSRPMQVDWARSVRDQAVEFDVPFFFKQWGNYTQVDGKGEQLVRLRSKNARLFDSRIWDDLPVPTVGRLSGHASTSGEHVIEPPGDEKERTVTMQ